MLYSGDSVFTSSYCQPDCDALSSTGKLRFIGFLAYSVFNFNANTKS